MGDTLFVLSWNINRFSGLQPRDTTLLAAHLEDCPCGGAVISTIQTFFEKTPQGLVLLQEVPGWSSQGMGRFFRWGEKRSLLKDLCRQFPTPHYHVFIPQKKAHSYTVAIWKDGWEPQPHSLDLQGNYTNRYVPLVHPSSGLQVLGLHAPEDMDFLTALQTYARKRREEDMLLVGDFNISSNPRRVAQIRHQLAQATAQNNNSRIHHCQQFLRRWHWLTKTMPELGYEDTILGSPATHLPTGHTIDHALVSPTLHRRVTTSVPSPAQPPRSDHAMVLVHISL